jgi:hypothetical protein
MVNCPFKFLDAYCEKDVNYFFGRDKESDDLYDFVEKNRIVLVYGPLGTGKTSLVRCGLEKKYGSLNWCPVVVRREENINFSLANRLLEKLPENRRRYLPANSSGTDYLLKVVAALSAYYITPVFLIFDQFEEFLLFAGDAEKAAFIETMEALKNRDGLMYCNIILVLREEFFGLLDKFEKDMPGLSDRRLRVDPMQPEDIRQMMTDTLLYPDFNISLEKPARDRVQQMYNAVAGKNGDVFLPNLQIYLDGLWRDEFARTAAPQYNSKGYPALYFSVDEIEKFGQIQDVLERFLNTRRKKIAADIKRFYPGVGEDSLNALLNEFVSGFGTKVPVAFKIAEGKYFCQDIEEKFHHRLPRGCVSKLIEELVNSKILRAESSTIELSHDILARLIDNQRDSKERKRIRIKVNIQSYIKEKDESISFDEVKAWEKEIEQCGLNREELAFFNKMKARRFKEERDRMLAEEKSKLKQKKHNQLKLLAAAVILLVVIIGYIQLRNSTYSLYAYDFFNRKVRSMNDNWAALLLSGYIYNHSRSTNNATRMAVQQYITDLANDSAIQRKRGILEYTLASNRAYTVKNNIDIAASGRYLVMRPDLNGDPNTGSFIVLDTDQPDREVQFSNTHYAYFLSDTDTLLLALNNEKRGLTNPNTFILFDCRHWAVIDTVKLQRYNEKGSENLLYEEDFLSEHRYTPSDSYDIRLTSSGNLLIPFLKTGNADKQNYLALLDRKLKLIMPPVVSDFSCSNSRDYQYFMTGFKENDSNYMRLFREDGAEYKTGIANFTMGDFTPDNAIIYTNANSLSITNSMDTSRYIVQNNHIVTEGDNIDYAFADARSRTVLLQSDSRRYTQLCFFGGGTGEKLDEKLLYINWQHKQFITAGYSPVNTTTVNGKTCTFNSILYLHNIDRSSNSRESHPEDSTIIAGCITGMACNSTTGLILLNTVDSTGKLRLFLYNNKLKMNGIFNITPNDSYFFSQNGQKMVLVRDNQLTVFNTNGDIADFTSFNNIIGWISMRTNPGLEDSLRKKHDVSFPGIVF